MGLRPSWASLRKLRATKAGGSLTPGADGGGLRAPAAGGRGGMAGFVRGGDSAAVSGLSLAPREVRRSMKAWIAGARPPSGRSRALARFVRRRSRIVRGGGPGLTYEQLASSRSGRGEIVVTRAVYRAVRPSRWAVLGARPGVGPAGPRAGRGRQRRGRRPGGAGGGASVVGCIGSEPAFSQKIDHGRFYRSGTSRPRSARRGGW